MGRPLQVGDVILYEGQGQKHTLVVVGFSPRGKTRLRREGCNERSAWWSHTHSLPSGYRCIGTFTPEAAA